MKTALIAGSTGLIGKQLLQLLLDSPEYEKVKAISRKPLDLIHSKLENIITDLSSLEANKEKLTADDVFCCLGTTIKTAGSKKAFEAVDYDYPLLLAQLAKARGAHQYGIVSALGASKESSFYYNQVKANIEEAITKVGFQTVHIFRPSLLLGDRQENRPGEEAAKVFYKIFGFLIPAKYKGVDGGKVANAMLHFARMESKGVHIHESSSLQKF